MKRNLLFLLAISLVTSILASCAHLTYYDVNYDLNCKNCGSTTDNMLTVSITKKVNPDYLTVSITNNKDEAVLIDERYFVTTHNDVVVQSPNGIDDPNAIHSWSSSYSISSDKPYSNLYNLFERDYKYNVRESTTSSDMTSTVYQPLIIIPPKCKINYAIHDYISDYFEMLKLDYQIGGSKYYKNKKGEIVKKTTDNLGKVTSKLDSLNNSNLGFTIVYKGINDDKWRSFTIKAVPEGIKLIEKDKDSNYEELSAQK